VAQPATINVTQVIDGGRFGSFQWTVAIWCGVLVMLDGFDNAAISYVAPVLTKSLGVGMPSFGPIFGAGLFGLMLGALASGPLADRFGRKIVVLTSTLIFSVFALTTVLAHSIDQLYAVRFLTGLGVGGLMPNSIALTAEYAPRRIRATVIAVMFLGFPLGAGGGGFIGAAMIPQWGWQSMFFLGGLLPLILLPIAIMVLPESIRFLVARGGQPTRIASLLNRLTGKREFDGTETFVISEQKLHGFTVRNLLTEGRAFNTALLWITFFCNLLVIYYMNSWLPSVLHEVGVPLGSSLRLAGALSWSGIASTIILGPIVDRYGAAGVVTVLYLFAACLVFGVGLAGASVPLLTLTIVGCGACVIGGQSFINVLSATLYPTSIRSTGVGWALGIGRIGAIVGPVVGGVLLAAHFSPRNLFFTIAVPALIAAGAMFWLRLRLRRVDAAAPFEAVVTR
jgi:AAHS family 4-hydroxybenzoate transporter-like MFS transporter